MSLKSRRPTHPLHPALAFLATAALSATSAFGQPLMGDHIATDNGDPTSFESFQSKERAALNGLVLVVIRTRPGESGPITLRATSPGLAPTEVTLQSK